MAIGGLVSASILLGFAVCVFGQYETYNNPINRPTALDCKTTKYSSKMLFGKRIQSAGSAPTADECVARCWRWNAISTRLCRSVNYWRLSKTCDLFEDSYEQGRRPDWFQSLMDSSYCDHIVVQECQDQSSGTVPDSGSNPDPEPSRPNAGQQARAGSCGKPQVSPARNRIVGGMEARAHSIPWIVSMRKYGSFHFCGGTLIRVNDQRDESDIVITAAHCVDKSSTNPQIDIVAGAHKKTSKADGEQSVPAAQVVVHPRYGAGGATNNNDIAIIKLSRPIKFSRTIQPACLPSPNEKIADGTSGTVAGWGTLQEGGRTPDTLQQVSIPTISYQKCASQYGSSRINEQTQFCGGFDQGGKDSCQGDSGGPYFFQGRNGAVLQGVVSWGAGCARARYAGVYARVANYLDWIQQNVNSLSSIRG